MSWGLESSLARYSVVRCGGPTRSLDRYSVVLSGAEDYGCGLLRPPRIYSHGVCEERNKSEHFLKRFKALRELMTKYERANVR